MQLLAVDNIVLYCVLNQVKFNPQNFECFEETCEKNGSSITPEKEMS